MTEPSGQPWWLRPVSRLNALMLRAGVRIGSQHLLSVRGRLSGQIRNTPVSIVVVGGHRYVVSAEGLAWVRNARAAGSGELLRGRRRERVRLVELQPAERGPILRAFWEQVPAGRSFMTRLFGLEPKAGPDEFEAAAPRCPVFEIRPLEDAPGSVGSSLSA